MGKPTETIIRFILIGGIVIAVWNFNRSMERIADALTRIAERDNPNIRKHEGNT